MNWLSTRLSLQPHQVLRMAKRMPYRNGKRMSSALLARVTASTAAISVRHSGDLPIKERLVVANAATAFFVTHATGPTKKELIAQIEKASDKSEQGSPLILLTSRHQRAENPSATESGWSFRCGTPDGRCAHYRQG